MNKELNEYKDVLVVDFRRGKGSRQHIVYAHIKSKDGELLVAGTLDYCIAVLKERLPQNEQNISK